MSAKPVSDEPRILIILMGALGDIARGIAILRPIKSTYPKAHITWVTQTTWRPVLELHNDIDELLVFDRSVKGAFTLARELHSRHFDITLDMQRNFKSACCTFFSAARRKIGFHRKNSKEGNFLFCNEHIGFFSEDTPKLTNYLDFLRVIGVASGERPDFGIAANEPLREENQHISKHSFIAMVLGSSWESKDWTVTGYLELINIVLTESEFHVVLLGTGADQDIASQIMKGLSSEKVHNLVSKTSLKELVTVLDLAKVVVGPDSGPGHVSAALGTPYVSIFGPTAAERVGPYENLHLVVKADVPCAPCWKRRCPGLGQVCMRLVRGAQVWDNVKKALH